MASLSIKSRAGAAAAMTAASLFAQWAHWFIYEKIEFSSVYLCFTPLVLCLMYRLLMADCESGGKFSKPFIFAFTVLVPFAVSAIISAYMMMSYPDISTFSASAPESGIPAEIISLYSGRLVLTSAYLLVYSLIDLLIVSKIWDKLSSKKIKES